MTVAARAAGAPALHPDTVIEPAFFAEPAEPTRLLDARGRSVRADAFVARLLGSIRSGTTLGELLDAAADRELTYATVYVLALAGMLELDPAPPRPAATDPVAAADLSAAPPVSLVVVNYDGASDLPRLLRAIRRQDYPRLQTIVVDNDSRDRSLDVLRAAGERAEVVALSENLGFAGGLNAGLRRAEGKYVAVLNTDVELAPNAISAWVARALQSPEAAAVAPKMLLRRHPRFLNSLGNSVLLAGWGSDNFIGVLDAGQFDHVERVFSACFGAALLSREALVAVGQPDPGYFLYYEDSDWCYRAWRHGFSIVTAPGCRITHSFGGSTGPAGASFKLRLVARNRLRFVIRNLSGPSLRRYLASYVLADARAVASAAIKRGDYRAVNAYVRAYADLAADAPGLWRTRRRRRDPALPAPEPDWTLTVAPTPVASIGDEPFLSRAVVRHHYVPLFRLDRTAALKSSK